MRLANVTAAVVSAIMVFGCAPAAVAQDTSNQCADAYFAVGGYPRTQQVPDGWTAIYTPGGIFPWEAGHGYNANQDVGASNMVAAVDDYFAQCPNGRATLQGHSYGAGVVHVASVTLNERPYASQVHARVTGNPRHPGGVDDAWQGWQLMPGVTFRGALPVPDNFGTWIDVCNTYRDAICSMPNPLRQPREFVSSVIGYLFTGGHGYPWWPAERW